jgi:hypothetical protein
METLQIPCPKCGRELKLRDRSLLGRKGKCPKCEHSFILQEPEEVQLELAEPEPTGVGTSARWVPDGSASAATASRQATRSPVNSGPEPASNGMPGIPVLGANDGAAARLKELQKKNAKRRNMGLAVGLVVALAVGSVTYYAMTVAPAKPVPIAAKGGDEGGAAPADIVDDSDSVAANQFASGGSPTKGKPIELQYIPYGAQVVINIRPAELWKKETQGEELRFCLSPLAKLLEAKFDELFKRKPEQIEEAQICLIPGTRGSLPEVAAVIHLIEDAKKSQLLEDFGGTPVNDYDYPVYVAGERTYLIADLKTIAVGPTSQAAEMVKAIVERHPASDGIDELLPLTDRDRHLTIVAVPRTIRLHSSWWFAENLMPLVLNTCDWFGDEVESVAWSLHLGEKTFYSDLIMRNMSGVTAANLKRETVTKLNKLPYNLLDIVQTMNPREVGKRKVIGRFPKMVETFALASEMSSGPRYVRVTTPLIERAAPNLALGSLLAWDESTRTDFAKSKPTKTTEEVKLPDLIAERLKLKIPVDFRRQPLQDAFAYIGGEIKTTIEIDGDALKAGGFTKNMPQTFEGNMTAREAIVKILERYQDPDKPGNTMVIVVDEEKKKILVSTLAFCQQQNLKPYPVFGK